MNNSDNNMMYQQPNRYNMQNQQMHPNNGNVWNNQNGRGNLDLPNLQSLGINSQAQNPSNQGQNMNNSVGSEDYFFTFYFYFIF